jgi:hypothetical protein
MPQNLDNQITLFIKDENTGRHAFNPKALKALGVDPALARELAIQSKAQKNSSRT